MSVRSRSSCRHACTVDAAVAPAGILSCQAQHQLAAGPGAWGGTWPRGARQDVPVPAQHCLGSDQQPEPSEHVPWEAGQQGGQERPIGGGEPRPDRAQLPLQHRDLVA
jgi:hypothetical protein